MKAALQLRGVLASTRVVRRPVRRLNYRVRCASRETIRTDKAPAPIGAYSQGTRTGNLLFVGGQLGLKPGASALVSDSPAAQTEQAMKNMGAILEAGGSSFDKVVKATLLLSDISDFKEVNAVYAKYFTVDPPARVAFAVKELPLGAKVEIDAIATTE